MALIAERKYFQEEILENYLNEIYRGQGGAQGHLVASPGRAILFHQDLEQLTVGETALMAGLIRAPNRYSPYRSVDAARQRRKRRAGEDAGRQA